MNDAQNVREMSSSCAELFDFSFCKLNTPCQKYIQIRLSILGPKHSWDTHPLKRQVQCLHSKLFKEFIHDCAPFYTLAFFQYVINDLVIAGKYALSTK